MAYSTQRATSDGTLTDLALTINYIDRTDITVTIDNQDPSVAGVTWSWVDDTHIHFDPAVALGSEVLVLRNTQLAEVLNIFGASSGGGALFNKDTMDENFQQLLLVAQEAREGSNVSEIFTDLDMHLNHITNLADPVNDSDAASKGYVGAYKAAAAASATASAASATASATSAADSAASAAESALFATDSADSATSAATSAAQAAAALATFSDQYQGAYASDPATQPDGGALQPGNLYYNLTTSLLMIYSGTTWNSAGNSITPEQILTLLKTVDGVGSGLDADTLQGSAPTDLGLPAGAVQYFALAAAPDGWLDADGSEHSRVTEARLFAAIGTTFGAGDGSTTFNVPDLRGEFLRGLDDGRGVDTGRTLGSAQGDAIRNITGYFNPKSGAGADGNATGAFYNGGPTFGNALASSGGYTGYSVNLDASRVVPVASENRPRNVALRVCIKK